MRESIVVRVLHDGQFEDWHMHVEGDGPWVWRLVSPDGRTSEVSGTNAFEAVRQIHEDLATDGMTLCCNGARFDVRPSGLSSSHGAWMVYVLHMWRPPTLRDLVPTFGYADPSRIGTVQEQDAYWKRHLKNRKNGWNFVNPLWWIYFATASCGRPKIPREIRGGAGGDEERESD